MARKKEPTPEAPTMIEESLEGGADTGTDTIQEALTDAANAFAQEILRILGSTTLSELTQLAGRAAEGAVTYRRGPGRPPKIERGRVRIPTKKPSPRTSALRRMAGTKPVPCPVQGCENPGIRSKMNFCNEHAESLSKADRVRLRQLQRANHQVERTVLPENFVEKITPQKAPPAPAAKLARKAG